MVKCYSLKRFFVLSCFVQFDFIHFSISTDVFAGQVFDRLGIKVENDPVEPHDLVETCTYYVVYVLFIHIFNSQKYD